MATGFPPVITDKGAAGYKVAGYIYSAILVSLKKLVPFRKAGAVPVWGRGTKASNMRFDSWNQIH